MSASRLILTVLVLMVAAITLSEGLRGTGPKKCCFNFIEKPLPKGRVLSYARTSQQCTKSAILLKTLAGRQLCVRPSAPWVNDIIKYLDEKTNPGEMSSL
ncbi:monocyte chemotactic protein 1B [Echeneis naucrates]|uniref:C-C motif chemokine n=1 Tax=Echeneis naucrates TaxID=173247 RepID=A0A665V8R5_ECHNA|nr:C-C motif chemokine 17 [Echeneis naucrates]